MRIATAIATPAKISAPLISHISARKLAKNTKCDITTSGLWVNIYSFITYHIVTIPEVTSKSLLPSLVSLACTILRKYYIFMRYEMTTTIKHGSWQDDNASNNTF